MRPAQIIEQLKAERRGWSPAQILEELSALAPLPDEGDPSWDSQTTWHRVYQLVALSDLVAERRVVDGIGLVLDRMALGDPGETMRGLRHAFEAAVSPDWWRLAEICLARCESPRAGTRLWAVEELGVIRDAASVPALLERLDDPDPSVAVAACRSLLMVARHHDEIRFSVATALRALVRRRPEFAAEVEADLEQLAPAKPVLERDTKRPARTRPATPAKKKQAAPKTRPPAKRKASRGRPARR